MRKFEFELDGIDTENLFGLFQSAQIKALSKILEYSTARDRAQYTWWCDHLRYLQELEALVFSCEVVYTTLPKYRITE